MQNWMEYYLNRISLHLNSTNPAKIQKRCEFQIFNNLPLTAQLSNPHRPSTKISSSFHKGSWNEISLNLGFLFSLLLMLLLITNKNELDIQQCQTMHKIEQHPQKCLRCCCKHNKCNKHLRADTNILKTTNPLALRGNKTQNRGHTQLFRRTNEWMNDWMKCKRESQPTDRPTDGQTTQSNNRNQTNFSHARQLLHNQISHSFRCWICVRWDSLVPFVAINKWMTDWANEWKSRK